MKQPFALMEKGEKMTNHQRIKELVSQLNTYRDAYYNGNTSLISDKEYDELFDELARLEQSSGIVLANSPTQTVGYEVVSKLEKVKHNHPLLSLGKTTDLDEFSSYFGSEPYVVMAKMDGLTCSLLYQNGKLVRAESRGNGEIGEDITHNVKTIGNVPLQIPFNGELIVDGECIITYDDFEKINKPLIEQATREAEEQGLTGVELKEYVRKHSYANPRNLASGSVRQLDSNIAKSRHLKFIAWKLHKADGGFKGDTYTGGFFYLATLGFEVVPNVLVNRLGNTTDAESAIDMVKEITVKRRYPIDGMVGAFNDVEYGLSLGSTGHHPKHSLAFKFYQEENETTLLDIEWSTSRTGQVNPVAIFEPVEIDGSTVSRASLTNVSIIKELELGIGDTITVIKANAIIPKVVDNLTRSNTYKVPEYCPECGMKLELRNDNGREVLYCINDSCPAIVLDRFSNFVSREAMNIVGLSDERLKTLMENDLIHIRFNEIYSLHKYQDRMESIPGFGKSSVKQLLKSIEDSRNCNLQNLIVAIGIPGVGKSAAKILAEYCTENTSNKNPFHRLLDLAAADFDWSQLPEIGEVTSNAINRYINDRFASLVVLADELNVKYEKKSKSTELAEKTFCITGKLEKFASRNQLVEDIESKGGSVVSSVTAKTMYLITNDKTSGSSKNKAAEKFGTKIISEEEYLSGNF